MALTRMEKPCWEAYCDGCGEGTNSDYGGAYHHASLAEAEQTLRDMDWVHTEAGKVYCGSCVSGMGEAERERLGVAV